MISWSDIDLVRNYISCYEQPEQFESKTKGWTIEKQRAASLKAMRKLYASRRKLGLNAHGKPFKIKI
jgi:hypothetical protein